MNPAKKAKLEKYAVIGLLIIFVLVFLSTLTHMGLFRDRKARSEPEPSAPRAEVVDMSRSLASTFKEHMQEMDSSPVTSYKDPHVFDRTLSSVTYSAYDLRDPFDSLLPPAQSSSEGLAATSQHNTPKSNSDQNIELKNLPPLDVLGMWWGDSKPTAIINNKLYGIGDEVAGATITAIDRKGVTLEHNGQVGHLVPPEVGSVGQGFSKTSQWR